MNTKELNEIVTKLEHWCSYQDRSIFEAIQKLDGFGVFGDQRDKVIQQLKSNRFLDERRFVESYVQGKFRMKGWGKIKIQNFLKQKHRVATPLIEEVFEEMDQQAYREKVRSLLILKLESLPDDISWSKKKEKCFRNLQSKGYELNLIFEIWETLSRDN